MPPAFDAVSRFGLDELQMKKKRKRVSPGVNIGDGRIAVDLWRKDTSARFFFLTHCHTDHTSGLTPSWRLGPIYCSPMTAQLLKVMYDLSDAMLRPLEVNESHQMTDFCVTVLDANHCPGAVMYLFESDSFGTFLCTGDMRYDHRMEQLFATESAFKRLQNLTIDHIYLDNTYLDEAIADFPTREQAIEEVAEIISERPDHDVFIGVNKLGKEEMLVGVAKSLQEWIKVDTVRMKTLEAIGADDVFTTESNEGDEYVRINTCSMQKVNERVWHSYKENRPAIGIVASMMPLIAPTNHERGFKRDAIHWVRYSDHSSSSELISFLKRLKFRRLTPIAKEISPERLTELVQLSAERVVDDSGNDDTRHVVPQCSRSDATTISALPQQRTVLAVRAAPIRVSSSPTRCKRGPSPVQFDTPPPCKKRRLDSPDLEQAAQDPTDVIRLLLEVGQYCSTNPVRFDSRGSAEESTSRQDSEILNIAEPTGAIGSNGGTNAAVITAKSRATDAATTDSLEQDPLVEPNGTDYIVNNATVMLWANILSVQRDR